MPDLPHPLHGMLQEQTRLRPGYPPLGTLYTLTLNSDSTYQRYNNGISDSGTFTIIQVKNDPGGNILGSGIVFSKGPSWPMFYHFGMDSLVLSDNISDGFTRVYERLH